MIALVTGATRGIGRRIALEIASLGYDMAIVGRDMKKLEAVKAEMEGLGRKVETICEDLADPSSYKRVISAAAERFGGIDVLVNCAGLSLAGPFTEATPEQWDRIFAVNAKAPFFLCQEALPFLKLSRKPVIINIASVVGFKGYPNQSVYSSSKHALTGFTKVLAKEVQPLGIRVHLISPGAVATEMVTRMRPDIDPDELIQPDEIAEIVRFILTREGSSTIDQFYIRRFGSLAFD